MFATRLQTATLRERTIGKRSAERTYPSAVRINSARRASCACGGGCPKCEAEALGVQAKLAISKPGDSYEQEADRVADQIMRTPQEQQEEEIRIKPVDGSAQRQVLDLEEEEEPADETLRQEDEEEALQAKDTPPQPPVVGNQTSAMIRSLRGGGQPLPQATRKFFESRMGHDFSKVRIHADNTAAEMARSVRARAFTRCQDVVFNRGEYAPHSFEGRRLLAHELVHVVQQGGGRGATTSQRAPEFLQRQPAADQASDCSGWEGDRESFTKLIAEHYVSDALGTSGRGMSVSCSGTPQLCIWQVKTPNDVISVAVSLASVPHHVIARQVFASGALRCEYEYVCPPGGNPVFQRLRCD